MSLFPLHAISVTESPLPSIVFSLLTFNELFSTSSFSLFKNPSFLEKNILCTLSWVNLLPKKLTICSLSNIWTMFYFFVVFDSDCDFFFFGFSTTLSMSHHISEYDMAEEGDLFKALEKVVLFVDQLSASLSMIYCGKDFARALFYKNVFTCCFLPYWVFWFQDSHIT